VRGRGRPGASRTHGLRPHRRVGRRGRRGSPGVGIEQDVAEGGADWGLDLDYARPAGGVGGGGELREAVAVGGEFEEGAVGEVRAGTVDFEGRGGVIWGGDQGGPGGKAGFHAGRLREPGAGVALLGVAALLEAGAPEVDVTRGPGVAIGVVLAHHDPQAGLPARERPRHFEALPGGCQRDLGRAGQVFGVAAVHDCQRDLTRAGRDACPDVEGVGVAVGQTCDLLLDHGRVGDGRDRVRRLVAVRCDHAVGRHRAASAVALPDAGREILGAEFFNVFNNVNFRYPTTNAPPPRFGRITSANDPRLLQFAFKTVF